MVQKRVAICFLCLILAFSNCILCSVAEIDQTDLSVANGCHSIDGAVPFLGQEQLVEDAHAVFVYETGSETLMYAWNADTPMYPASLVKLMTALLVLEKGNLSDEIVVTQSALDAVSSDAISADLQPGESMSVENLMYCMIVHSANDAAAVLAEYISGSQSEFVDLMNSRAAELGCTGTTYTNPHGLHNELQVTTARDTCRVLQAALEHETFRTMFGSVYYTVPATNKHEQRELSTNNYLMNTDSVYYDGRVTGGRTGVTTEGYRCVATTSQSGNMEMICIVMVAKSVYSEDSYSVGFPETSDLLDKAYSGYSRCQIIYENQILRQQQVLNGDSDVFAASYEAFSTVLPSDISFDQLSFRYSEAPGSTQAPIKKGQNLAALQVWYGSLCIAQTDVYAMNDVPVAYGKSITFETGSTANSWWIWLLIVVGLLTVLTIAAFLWMRYKGAARRKKRHRHIKRRGK